MLYAIKLIGTGARPIYLAAACFDPGNDPQWRYLDVPAQARKFSMPGDAAALVEVLPFSCEVVSVGSGKEYEPPAVRPETNGEVH
jgi:hypothetical protein